MAEHQILEHTADVGVRATASSMEELFEEVTLALLEITGASIPAASEHEVVPILFEDGRDVPGLLVDWLSEVLYEQDARDRVVSGVRVERVTGSSVAGSITVANRPGPLEGTPVKAVTYHQLVVDEQDGVFTAQVFFDI